MTKQVVQSTTNERGGVSHASFEEVQSKEFNWEDFGRGDCHQTQGKLILSANGTGYWSCVTWTDHTHTHDVWHCHFDVVTAQQAKLFNKPQFDSPDMSDGDPPPHYEWGNAFTFDGDKYDAIGGVLQYCGC